MHQKLYTPFTVKYFYDSFTKLMHILTWIKYPKSTKIVHWNTYVLKFDQYEDIIDCSIFGHMYVWY